MEERYRIFILTVSDRCAAGEREDLSGPALEAWLREKGVSEISRGLVPDEKARIMEALCRAAEADIALVLTTGGTGFAPRDVTPEATAAVCEKLCPGVGEAMRAYSLQITPRGMLSRGTAGIRGRTLIVNLPGSPRAALENLEPVFEPLLHGLKMLRQGPADCAASAEAARQSDAAGEGILRKK